MLFLLCYLFHVFNIPLLVCSIQPEVQVQNRYSDTNDNRDWHSFTLTMSPTTTRALLKPLIITLRIDTTTNTWAIIKCGNTFITHHHHNHHHRIITSVHAGAHCAHAADRLLKHSF